METALYLFACLCFDRCCAWTAIIFFVQKVEPSWYSNFFLYELYFAETYNPSWKTRLYFKFRKAYFLTEPIMGGEILSLRPVRGTVSNFSLSWHPCTKRTFSCQKTLTPSLPWRAEGGWLCGLWTTYQWSQVTHFSTPVCKQGEKERQSL